MTPNLLRCYLPLLIVSSLACFASYAHAQNAWKLHGTKIYVAPDAPPTSGTITITDGKITAVKTAKWPAKAARHASRCDGGVIVAGFQNSHVHFTSAEFSNARTKPAAELEAALERMLTQYGYTTVFDIASDRDNTFALRSRIESGEIRGPRILTAGWSLFPVNGLPMYIAHLPKELLAKLPQPVSAQDAEQIVRDNLHAGADGTKLFIASPQGMGVIKRMSSDIVAAAVQESHRQKKLVFAHPTDIRGVQEALDLRVDILAHPPLGAPAPWPETLLVNLRDAGVSMIPTLKLLPYELGKERVPPEIATRIVNESVAEFGRFAALGGQVLFGTDVGYMSDYDPTLEYELMAKAGLTHTQILASLTTAPAARWDEQNTHGRIAVGMNADIVVLEADPAESVRNFAAVRCAIRGGKVIYVRQW